MNALSYAPAGPKQRIRDHSVGPVDFRNPEEATMSMKLPMALTVSGLVLAGGVTLAASPANAATGQGKVSVSPNISASAEFIATAPDDRRPRCRRYVKGHYQHVRGRTMFIPGRWMPRGCVRR